ncbi:MAG: hypothetical protein PHF20_04900 [Halothiobacillaceae bacterium]|nr:hypothetical protein [Halothiobacillaceae bacterium]
MEGLADIIPPPPAHDGLAALLAPSSSTAYGWLLVLLLVILLVTAVLLRRHWAAHWRLWQARRALHRRRPAPEIVTQIERSLRQHHHLSVLHPARTPYGVDASIWRGLIDNLHAAKFGDQAACLNVIQPALAACFLPSKSRETKSNEERAIVGCAMRTNQADEGAHGAPYQSRLDGAQASRPRKDQGTQP